MEVYFIHDNGSRPFQVHINNQNIVEIFDNWVYRDNKHVHIFDDEMLEPVLIDTIQAKEIFIGRSPQNRMTMFSGGHGSAYLGNSILLCTENNEYTFIGDCIYSFTSLSNITEFVSPVGNNDVPYPFAFDEQRNLYDMNNRVIFKDSEKLKYYLQICEDPNSIIYNVRDPGLQTEKFKNYMLLHERQ